MRQSLASCCCCWRRARADPTRPRSRTQVQEQIDKSFKPGLLELAALKRQGSSPLPAGEGGAARVLVYYNATLRLQARATTSRTGKA